MTAKKLVPKAVNHGQGLVPKAEEDDGQKIGAKCSESWSKLGAKARGRWRPKNWRQRQWIMVSLVPKAEKYGGQKLAPKAVNHGWNLVPKLEEDDGQKIGAKGSESWSNLGAKGRGRWRPKYWHQLQWIMVKTWYQRQSTKGSESKYFIYAISSLLYPSFFIGTVSFHSSAGTKYNFTQCLLAR